MGSVVSVPTEKLIELCEGFFEVENARIAKESAVYRAKVTTKRRLFGLLGPKYSKHDVDQWEIPTIYDSMEFQTMYPHHKIAELLLSADLAKTSGINGILVDADLFCNLGCKEIFND